MVRNLINRLQEWRDANYEKKIEKMRLQGNCPQCSGRGFDPVMINEFMYLGAYEDYKCPGCNGSGQFNDWNQNLS